MAAFVNYSQSRIKVSGYGVNFHNEIDSLEIVSDITSKLVSPSLNINELEVSLRNRDLQRFASLLGYSSSHLKTVFRSVTGNKNILLNDSMLINSFITNVKSHRNGSITPGRRPKSNDPFYLNCPKGFYETWIVPFNTPSNQEQWDACLDKIPYGDPYLERVGKRACEAEFKGAYWSCMPTLWTQLKAVINYLF